MEREIKERLFRSKLRESGGGGGGGGGFFRSKCTKQQNKHLVFFRVWGGARGGGGGGVLWAVLPCKWFKVSACGSICVYLSLRTCIIFIHLLRFLLHM